MERLTKRKFRNDATKGFSDPVISFKINDRLADIEDILGDEYDLDLVQKLIQAYREGRYIILKEPEQAGISRLRELAQADREGRCVVLPCKIGDTLYRIQRFKCGKNWRKEAEYIRTAELNKNNFWRVVFDGELGETVFLTREAAEAALKGEQHEQNL